MNGLERVPKLKNRHLRTFVPIDIDSRVVRPPRLFLLIPTDPKTSAKANFEFQRRFKFFFAHFKSNLHVFKRATFRISEAIFMQKVPKVGNVFFTPPIWGTMMRFSDF